ncbi:DUF6207 family protein [Streptomyces fungicidicus]|uniref:DUF6207 family protein n=1 Tax=Streptomyces fungicidicus TaxID=68203 RepID=UPI0036AAF686
MTAPRRSRAIREISARSQPCTDGWRCPGLAVVEVSTADHETAFAVQELLATRWPIVPVDRITRYPGEAGVRLRRFLDLRQRGRAKVVARSRFIFLRLSALRLALLSSAARVTLCAASDSAPRHANLPRPACVVPQPAATAPAAKDP